MEKLYSIDFESEHSSLKLHYMKNQMVMIDSPSIRFPTPFNEILVNLDFCEPTLFKAELFYIMMRSSEVEFWDV